MKIHTDKPNEVRQSIDPKDIRVGDLIEVEQEGMIRKGVVGGIYYSSYNTIEFFSTKGAIIYNTYWGGIPKLIARRDP